MLEHRQLRLTVVEERHQNLGAPVQLVHGSTELLLETLRRLQARPRHLVVRFHLETLTPVRRRTIRFIRCFFERLPGFRPLRVRTQGPLTLAFDVSPEARRDRREQRPGSGGGTLGEFAHAVGVRTPKRVLADDGAQCPGRQWDGQKAGMLEIPIPEDPVGDHETDVCGCCQTEHMCRDPHLLKGVGHEFGHMLPHQLLDIQRLRGIGRHGPASGLRPRGSPTRAAHDSTAS